MSILNPIWLLATCALLIAYLVIRTRSNGDDWYKLVKTEVLHYLGNSASSRYRLPALLVACICTVALANPALPKSDSNTYTHAQGWFVIADLSRSMTLEDVSPTRLSAMRNTIHAVAEKSQSRPLALVIFAGDAFMIAPPAFDKQHVNQHINLLEHGLVPLEGSNLTRALSLVSSVIESSQMLNARIFVFGDTGGFTTKAQAAVARLAARDHRTDVIVFGTQASSSGNAEYNLQAARDIANAGNGLAIESDALGVVPIDRLELNSVAISKYHLIPSTISLLRWQSLSHWPLLLALPLLLFMFRRERN